MYGNVVEFHTDLNMAKTVRELRAVLRAGVASELVHVQSECATCIGARNRIEDAAHKMHQRVEHDLSLHSPRSDAVAESLDRLRSAAKTFAHEVIESTPACREQSLALTSIETALQQASAARVRNQ